MPAREDVYQKSMNQGHSFAWDQEWKKAADCYRNALKEFPDHPKALSSLGLALIETQEFDEALPVYMQVAKVSPNDPAPYERISQLSERLGHIKDAEKAAMKAAELHLTNRDVEKGIENWVHVTMLNPEHTLAHSRLALTHEKLGHKQQAVIEYLAVASLLQRGGNMEKAAELVKKALQLSSGSKEAKQAERLLRAGQLLPKPVRPRGGIGALAMSQVKKLNPDKVKPASSMDPIAEASQKALTTLAEVLFEYSEESAEVQTRRGLSAIVKGTGQLLLQQGEQTKIVLHLGQAIDAQAKKQNDQAADELKYALKAGFDHPALYFNLGMLRAKSDHSESALRYLGNAVKHVNFALGSRLLMGELLVGLGRLGKASVEYLEALKKADSMIVSDEHADVIREHYEPLIEAQITDLDEANQERLCKNIKGLLMREDWRNHLSKMREQLPKTQEGDVPTPLAEAVIKAQSSQVLDAVNKVNQLARQGQLRSAMDEAFHALQNAPTYLPLHTLIGDLLVSEGNTTEAIAKYTVIASAYGVRGESSQSTKMLRRVIELSPMDLRARTSMIDHMIARGEVDAAIKEYLEVADIYYRLAELDMARKTFTKALSFVQKSNADRSWNVTILQRMADIDMQRLDWKQAMRVFEQIRTLRPDDEGVRRNLVALNLRMGNQSQAVIEMENYLSYLSTNRNSEQGISFLEELIKENKDQIILHRALIDQFQEAGKTAEAILALDALGELLVEEGKKSEAAETIQQILLMNPPNADDYRKLLSQLQA